MELVDITITIKVVKHAKAHPFFMPYNSPSLVIAMMTTALAIRMTSGLKHYFQLRSTTWLEDSYVGPLLRSACT